MNAPSPSPEDRLLPLLDRLRHFDADAPAPEGWRVSPPQAALLSAVAASPGSSLQAIARNLGLAPPTVSVAVSRLESTGLLERRPDHQDGRAIRIYLSAQGDALHRRIVAARRDRAAHLLCALAPEERHLLVDMLSRVLSQAGGLPPRNDPTRGRRGIAGLVRRLRGIWGAAP